MIYPVNFIAITQPFSSNHFGVDFGWFSSSHHNQPIYSVCDGVVIDIQNQKTGGLVVHIYNEKLNIVCEYAHLHSTTAVIGEYIDGGENFAKMGKSGKVTGEHLHFGMYRGTKIDYSKPENWLNPLDYIKVDAEYQTINEKSMKLYPVKFMQNNEIKDNDYVCNYDLYVRTGPSTNHSIKLVKNLTKDGQKNATSQNTNALASYKNGTVFTALEIINNSNGTWARTPSGYVCIIGKSGKTYCEKK